MKNDLLKKWESQVGLHNKVKTRRGGESATGDIIYALFFFTWCVVKTQQTITNVTNGVWVLGVFRGPSSLSPL